MRRIFNYVPSKTTLMRGAAFLVVLFVAVLLGSVWAVLWLAHENDILDERDRQSLSDRSELRRDLDAEVTRGEVLEEQIRSLGEQPVVDPDDIPADTEVVVVPGRKGDRGLSCIEEIGYPRCRGDEGSEGTDGSVGASCVAELGLEACRGPEGNTGPAGKDGKDGADGAPGPPGTTLPGTYACPAGEYLTGFGVAADGSVSLSCASALPGNPGGGQ